ncbi:MAG: peptidase S41 [Ruminococcus sp.]|nr:peptidase S41 [Ruminococcus sp.]MBP3267040.1 peptidase S41 [Ruminococcus sp.]
MEYLDIVLVMIELALCVFLWKFSDYCERVRSSKWKLVWLTPLVLWFIISVIVGVDKCLISAYVGIIILALGFFREKLDFRRIISVIAAVCIVLAVPVCLLSKAYRRVDYTAEFEEIFEKAEKRYVLTKHKNIDWKALHDKYLPEFRKATKDRDEVGNYIAWGKLCAEFHDGHVNYISEDKVSDEACRRAWGNDYGLVVMALADGRYVALNVDDSLKNQGIHQLTEIISWDGMTLEEADSRSVMRQMKGYADIDNEKFYSGLFAAGVGGDCVKVTFIADDGTEKTAELPKIGDYQDRAEAYLKKLNQSTPIANMTFTKLDDETACLKMCGMEYDSESSSSEDYTIMKRQLKNDLLDLRNEGVKNLVLDIRGNVGGEGGVVTTIASLLAPEGKHLYANNPQWDDKNKCYVLDEEGNYIVDDAVEFEGMDLLNGGKIIILVNSASVSAADHLTKVMSQFDNVTVMGFTEPNGSAQGVSSISSESGILILSSSAVLDKDGSIFVDSDESRQSGDDLDIRIPFDEEAVHEIFDEDNDYIMDKAMEQMKEK